VEKTAPFSIQITAMVGQKPLSLVMLTGLTVAKAWELERTICRLLSDARDVTPGLTLHEMWSVETTGYEPTSEPCAASGNEEF
jgi:hypothetical protein